VDHLLLGDVEIENAAAVAVVEQAEAEDMAWQEDDEAEAPRAAAISEKRFIDCPASEWAAAHPTWSLNCLWFGDSLMWMYVRYSNLVSLTVLGVGKTYMLKHLEISILFLAPFATTIQAQSGPHPSRL
jgi:hypothetical protein